MFSSSRKLTFGKSGSELPEANQSKAGVDESTMDSDGSISPSQCFERSQNYEFLNHPLIRQLISQFANIFSLRCTVTNATKENSLKFSQRYRSVLQSIVLNDGDANGDEDLKSKNIRKVLSLVDLTWALAEALYFSSPVFVSRLLLDWMQQHTTIDPEGLKLALKRGVSDEESSRTFWNVLFKLLTQGFFHQTISMLSVLADYFHEQYSTVCEPAYSEVKGQQSRSVEKSSTQYKLVMDIIMLLKQNPISRCTQFSTIELNSYSSMWKNSFKELKIIAEACEELELTMICALCAGEKTTLNKLMKGGADESSGKQGVVFGRWFETVVTYCVFVDPSITIQDLNKLLPSLMYPSAIESSVDQLIYALFTADNLKIAYHICSVFPDSCTAMHLVDLFYYSGYKLTAGELIPGLDKQESGDFLWFLLKDFGCKLMKHSNLWPFAFSYLMHLNNLETGRKSEMMFTQSQAGTTLLTALIGKIEPLSDQQALNLVNLCLKHGLSSSVVTIGRKRSLHHLEKGNLLSASVWAVRSSDVDIATRIANDCLKVYLDDRRLELIAGILDNLSRIAQVKVDPSKKSQSILFVHSTLLDIVIMFYDYVKLRSVHEDYEKAARLLMDLIKCPSVPWTLQLCLLLDSSDFLEVGLIRDSNDVQHLREVFAYIQNCVSIVNHRERIENVTSAGLSVNDEVKKELKALQKLLCSV